MSKALAPEQREAVRTAVLATAVVPKPLAELKKAAKAAIQKDKKLAEEVVGELIQAGELHKQGAAKSAPYSTSKPVDPNDSAKVRDALLAAASNPQSRAKLIAAAMAETKADKKFVTEQVDQLIGAGHLHQQGAAKTSPLGREKPIPPHPLEHGPGKTAFGKLVTAARKLLDAVKGVEAAELLARLRSSLVPQESAPAPSPTTAKVAPAASTPTAHPATGATAQTAEQIRRALHEVYDELCLFPEFQDKLVELRRLYHATVRRLPPLTVDQFHRELEHLENARQVELHSLNEIQRAKEPELAITRGDRLLYFVIWR